jgi:hypothetical protein
MSRLRRWLSDLQRWQVIAVYVGTLCTFAGVLISLLLLLRTPAPPALESQFLSDSPSSIAAPWGITAQQEPWAVVRAFVEDSTAAGTHPGWTIQIETNKPVLIAGALVRPTGDATTHYCDVPFSKALDQVPSMSVSLPCQGSAEFHVPLFSKRDLPIRLRYRIARKGTALWSQWSDAYILNGEPCYQEVTFDAR